MRAGAEGAKRRQPASARITVPWRPDICADAAPTDGQRFRRAALLHVREASPSPAPSRALDDRKEIPRAD